MYLNNTYIRYCYLTTNKYQHTALDSNSAQINPVEVTEVVYFNYNHIRELWNLWIKSIHSKYIELHPDILTENTDNRDISM